MIHCVYKATNTVNGKAYVGKTSFPEAATEKLARRKREHLSEACRDRLNSHLYNAIRKYGFERFTFEVLEEFETAEEAYAAERRLIAALGTTDRSIGYNATSGGEGVTGLSPERRRKISDAAKKRTGTKNSFFGRRHSPETRRKISASRAKYKGEAHPLWGTSRSASTKQKISASKTGKALWTDEQKRQIGQRNSGEKSTSAKLTNVQAVELRTLFGQGTAARELQTLFGLSKAAVWRCINRLTYKEC